MRCARPKRWRKRAGTVAGSDVLRLIAWTPAETLLDVDGVAWVHVELANGRGITIWPGHAPLLAETVAETVRYRDRRGAQRVEFPAGILKVQEDTVTLFLTGGAGEPLSAPAAQSARRFERLADTLLTRR